jgi:diaminopimelate decarboxylase
LEAFSSIETPFYYYDTTVLRDTLEVLTQHAKANKIEVHYALKANANRRILSIIRGYGLGADCVSGGEVKAAIEAVSLHRK